MNQKSYLLILFIFLFANPSKISASHAVGADLTYVCLGGNNYRFLFTLYRDCSGIGVNQTYVINGTSTCGGNVNIIVSLDSVHEIPHTCPTAITTCVNFGSSIMGIEANYYHGDVTLPSACNFWTFGLSPTICNRNGAVNNLSPNGSTFCLYVEATLNNDAVQCNSSPTFSSRPVQFFCANQVQYYVEQAFDIDGDSLTYQMITPHSDATTDVIYIPGLSGSQPVSYSIDSTRFNPQTGEVRFVADGPQITVMAIQVNEYRNGVLIGSVERDIELIFENCLNNPPTATGINGTNIFDIVVCADATLSFSIMTNDVDPINNTFLTWNGGIPGASFITTGGHHDVGYFTWQPTLQQVSSQPYYFSVTVQDDACPTTGTNIYSYAIYVDSCFSTGIGQTGNGAKSFSAHYVSTNHSIHFTYKLNDKSAAVVSLYDLTGRELEKKTIEKKSVIEMEMNAHGLAPGMYIINLKTGDGTSQSVKVVVE